MQKTIYFFLLSMVFMALTVSCTNEANEEYIIVSDKKTEVQNDDSTVVEDEKEDKGNVVVDNGGIGLPTDNEAEDDNVTETQTEDKETQDEVVITEDGCKKDTDCSPPSSICIPNSVGSEYGTCQPGCQTGTCPQDTFCNTKLGRCLNTKGTEGACNEENCAEGCCVATDGMRGLTCYSKDHSVCTSLCSGPCDQGEVCLNPNSASSDPNPRCVYAACTGDDACMKLNSHIMNNGEPVEYTCDPEILTCKLKDGGSSGTGSTGDPNSCANEMDPCEDPNMTMQGNCCDGLMCLMNICLAL